MQVSSIDKTYWAFGHAGQCKTKSCASLGEDADVMVLHLLITRGTTGAETHLGERRRIRRRRRRSKQAAPARTCRTWGTAPPVSAPPPPQQQPPPRPRLPFPSALSSSPDNSLLLSGSGHEHRRRRRINPRNKREDRVGHLNCRSLKPGRGERARGAAPALLVGGGGGTGGKSAEGGRGDQAGWLRI